MLIISNVWLLFRLCLNRVVGKIKNGLRKQPVFMNNVDKLFDDSFAAYISF